MKIALTIAGSDSCGGAGIQADIKSFAANGVFGMSVITAVTAQNSTGVYGVEDISPDMIKSQIRVLFKDISIDAVKIGMVSKIESIKAIAEELTSISNLPQVVIDPVMVSKSGFKLLSTDAKDILIKELIPLATLLTPNIPEAEEILGYEIKTVKDMEEAAKKLKGLGPQYILLKGGHLNGDAIDILYDGEKFIHFDQKRIDTKNTHGTGCTLSSAIAANLAKNQDIELAVRNAKKYITEAIENSLVIGHGVGPTHHFYDLYKKAGIE